MGWVSYFFVGNALFRSDLEAAFFLTCSDLVFMLGLVLDAGFTSLSGAGPDARLVFFLGGGFEAWAWQDSEWDTSSTHP